MFDIFIYNKYKSKALMFQTIHSLFYCCSIDGLHGCSVLGTRAALNSPLNLSKNLKKFNLWFKTNLSAIIIATNIYIAILEEYYYKFIPPQSYLLLQHIETFVLIHSIDFL